MYDQPFGDHIHEFFFFRLYKQLQILTEKCLYFLLGTGDYKNPPFTFNIMNKIQKTITFTFTERVTVLHGLVIRYEDRWFIVKR